MTTPPTDPNLPLSWDPPGPGQWALDRSHVNRPATPINQMIQTISTVVGTRRGLAEIGAPLDGLDFRFVNGLPYSRVRPLIGPDKPPKKLPPAPLLKLAMKLHPEMRRRRRIAEQVLESRPWRDVIRRWSEPGGLREQIEVRNLAIQDVDLASLDDAALVAHVHRTVHHALEMWAEHMWLHNYDLGPIGMLLDQAVRCAIPTADVIPLLEGASPSTSEAEKVMHAIREAAERSGTAPRNLGELRSVSPEVSSAVDRLLRLRGRLVVSRYDIDGLTLAESPEVLFSTIMSARDTTARGDAARREVEERTAHMVQRVPADQRDVFMMLLAEARTAMDLRDDNGPHTLEWPLGLVRMALLEVGRRLVESGRAREAVHALEVTPEEIDTVLTDSAPSAEVLAGRAHWRATVNVEDAPRKIGPEEPVPPLDVLPDAMARIVGFVQIVIAEAGVDGEVRNTGLNGIGVGTAAYTGRARLAGSPEAALQQMEPGDVLVVPCTTPAFNLVLSMAGAVVTSEGGALSHAAVLARELGIPAVVGAPGALSEIRDGATVEVDPVDGVVRVLA